MRIKRIESPRKTTRRSRECVERLPLYRGPTDEPAFRRYRSLPQRRRTQQRDVGGRAHEPVQVGDQQACQRSRTTLGVRLLYRTTRNVEPTEAGHFFYKAAKASLQELNNAAEIVALRENDLCGELRIVTPMSFGTLWLSPIIADFMSQHPRLEIVLQMDDRLTDFEKEGYDLSIRVTRLDDSSLIARPLANSQRVVCCSPDYAERHGTLDTLEQLMQHECLGYNNATPSQVWTFEPAFPGAKPRAVSPRGRFSSNNGQAMRDAALRGQGLALLPLFIVAEDLKNGRLVDAAPGLRPLDDVIYAMYSRAAAMSPKVKAFIQHLQQALSIPPWGNG